LATNLLTSKRFDKIGYLLTVKSKDGLKSKSNIADLYISNFSKTQIFKDSKQTIEINKPGNYEIKIIPKSSLIDCGAGFGKEYIQKFNVESNSKVYISA
jgi:hypothetical protein